MRARREDWGSQGTRPQLCCQPWMITEQTGQAEPAVQFLSQGTLQSET